MINIECLQKACDELKLPYAILDKNSDFIRIDLNKPQYFVQAKTPFNNDALSCISEDKEFTYLSLKDELNIPKTKGYLDPDCDDKFVNYLEKSSDSLDNVTKDILEEFNLPVIVKMNRGYAGNNVFLCNDAEKIKKSLGEIYNKKSSKYNHIAIAQEMVDIEKEYRAIYFKGKIILLYDKFYDYDEGMGKRENLSPLHNKDAKAILVEDKEILNKIQNFVDQSNSLKNIQFSGLDIAVDKNGKIHLLELNSHPGFSYFVRDNGEEKLVEMYKILLEDLRK